MIVCTLRCVGKISFGCQDSVEWNGLLEWISGTLRPWNALCILRNCMPNGAYGKAGNVTWKWTLTEVETDMENGNSCTGTKCARHPQ